MWVCFLQIDKRGATVLCLKSSFQEFLYCEPNYIYDTKKYRVNYIFSIFA